MHEQQWDTKSVQTMGEKRGRAVLVFLILVNLPHPTFSIGIEIDIDMIETPIESKPRVQESVIRPQR